jgi:hypothetical protein
LQVFIVAQVFGILLGIAMAIGAAVYVVFHTLRRINYKG